MFGRDRSDRGALVALGMALLAIFLVSMITEPKQQITQTVASQGKQAEQGQDANQDAPTHVSDNDWHVWGDSWAQWLMAVFAVGATLVSLYAVFLLKDTLDANRDAVAEATKANKIARENAVNDLRPWIAVMDATLSSDVRVEPNNFRLHCGIKFRLKNVGKSPATMVYPHYKFYDLGYATKDANEGVRTIMKETVEGRFPIGITMFPGQESWCEISITGDPRDKNNGEWRRPKVPLFIGAVYYFANADSAPHWSGYKLKMTYIGGGAAVIPARDGSFPAEDFKLEFLALEQFIT